ncbi:MAG: hypothetical protein M3N14_05250 [Bacteroidota bacterium]|nr:hypothetical protein [Bacteroidota bacterium]
MKGNNAQGSPRKNIAAQVLSDLQGKCLCGQEASLLRAFLVTFEASNGVALLSAYKKQKQPRKT